MHVVVLVLPIFLLAGVDDGLRRFSFAEPHMGTRFVIISFAPNDALAKRAAAAAFARIAELDRIMSDYKPTSELMQLCAKAGGEHVRVSDDLYDVLNQAQEIARRSDGAFDVTIGPVTRIWRRARKVHELPDAQELAQARLLVGYKNLVLDPTNRTVKLAKPGMALDLGGIGKGFAADEALITLKKHGISRALVSAGGDVVCGDAPPKATGWKVGIATPENADDAPSRFIFLTNAAASTSGDFSQHLEADGKRYSHLIDPRTGIGLTERINVTVIAPRGRLADPFTKVVSVLGSDAGRSIVDETEHVAALITTKTGGQEHVIATARFPKIHHDGGVKGAEKTTSR